jgi:hypothetical protein
MRLSFGIALLVLAALASGLLLPGAPAWGQAASPGPAPPPAAAPPPRGDSPYILWTPWISGLNLPRNFLDDQLFGFDYPAGALQLPLDARTLQVEVDAAQGLITTGVSAADVPLGPERSEPLADYASRLTAASLRRQWVTAARARINQAPVESAIDTRPGFSIALPVELPKAMRSFLGDSPPALNVSGSERISIAGRSNWTNQQSVYGRSQSIFPQLDMRQDLDINIIGTLGDKVSVDVAQFSGVQTPLTNRIALSFSGEDDEILRKLDLGNTNLSLPGTQYVSYSGRNDGLFGVHAQGRLGGTDLTVIASRQEARSERTQFTGSTQTRTTSIEDWQYIQRTYFLLQLPDSLVDANGDVRPDAPKLNDLASIEVYLDDRISQDLGAEKAGFAEVADPRADGLPAGAPRGAALFGKFDRKEPIKDFTVRRDLFGEHMPVLVLATALPDNATLAVAFRDSRGQVGVTDADTLRLKLIKAPLELLNSDSTNTARFTEDQRVSPFAPTREYELRNFYSLGGRDLDSKTAKIQVRKISGGGQREYLEQFTDPTTGENITYLEVTGVDLLNQSQGGTAQPGQDGSLDRFGDQSLVDWSNGILYFPDLRPFAPRLDRPGDKYFYKTRVAPLGLAPRRRSFTLDAAQPDDIRGNDAPYMVRSLQEQKDAKRFYIYAEFSSLSGSNLIYLRNTPVVEGSEIVSVNGETLVRERDYRINYLSGSVELLSPKAREAGSALSVDYSYAPLFATADKTLIGGAVKVLDTENLSLGGAFLYEARGVQEKRPRAGEEPARTVIGDINGRIRLEPRFMSAMVNALPFYRASNVGSRLEVTAETGYSIPNPNTKNELYLDDFEGARSSNTAAMDARAWVWAAPPNVRVGAFEDSVSRYRDNAQLLWFNPYNVIKQKDLRPNLTRAEDSQASVNVLSWWIPRPWSGAVHDSLWVGLTQTLDADGVDLSRSQFIDLWLNDFRDFELLRRPGVKLHIDVGLVGEDQQRRPDERPNQVPDTEDLPPPDRQLTPEEDIGLDAVADLSETDLVDSTAAINASPSDPHGDDWRVPNGDEEKDLYPERDPRRWRFANGTEKNQAFRGVPDTEDLDGDGQLDTENSFFRYTIDLGDTRFLDTDVYEKYVNDPNVPSENQPAEDNGWRRFIIPLDLRSDDPNFATFGSADLHTIKHVRVWLEGVEGSRLPPYTLDAGVGRRPLLELAQLEVVGNRWVANAVDSTAALYGQDIVVRTVNNREDAAVYEPPFQVGTQTQTGSSVAEREQSLALRVVNLVPGGEVSAYRPAPSAEDYSRYRSVRFYAAGLDFSPADSIRFYVRFLSDGGNEQRNYYEYSAPVPRAVPLGSKPVPWAEYDLVLTDFSDLKIGLDNDSTQAAVERAAPGGGVERLRVVGRPSFTRVARAAIGLLNAAPAPDSASRDSAYASGRAQPGELWVDELRAYGVARDRGSAQRVTVLSSFSDLLSLNLNVDRQDENFQRLGQLRGSGNEYQAWRLTGSLGIEKFLRGSGFILPVNFGFADGRTLPRFRTGQDILLRGTDAEDERSTQWSRNWGASLSHGGSRSWLLRNTLDALAFRYSMQDDRRRTPTSVDTARVLSGGGRYSLSTANLLGVPLPLLKSRGGKPARLYLLPSNASLSFDMTTRRSVQYDRDAEGVYVSRLGRVYAKDAIYNLSAAWRPIEPLGYSFQSVRNANLPGVAPLRIGGINFGRQTGFQQRFDVRLPLRLTQWVAPEFTGSTSFTEARGPDLSPTLVLGNFANQASADMRWTIPFARLGRATPGKTGGAPVFARLLSRLGDFQVHGNLNRNTAYSRLYGYPNIWYRLGLDREPGLPPVGAKPGDPNFADKDGRAPSVIRDPQSSESGQRNLLGEVSTALALWNRGNARVRVGYSQNLRASNGQIYVNTNQDWPDLTADWGAVQRLLFLGGVFPTLSAQTRYSHKVSDEGTYGKPINARISSTNWQPLLSLTGTTKGGLQTVLAAEYSSSLREDFRNTRSFGGTAAGSANTSTTNLTVRAEASKTLSPGNKFSFFGLFGSSLKSTLTLALRSSYNRRTGGTTVPGQARVGGEIRNDRIDVSLSSTYNFSRNVAGTIGLGFNQYRDFTRAVFGSDGASAGSLAQRGLRLEANAQMSF